MENFFALNYTGKPFGFFDLAHIGALAAVFLLNLFLLRFKNKDETVRRKACVVMAVTLWLNESAWHIWNIYHGTRSIQ